MTAAKAELQPKLDAAASAREAAVEAEKVRVAAAERAREATRDLEPVSVFISRKTQRLYVRQAFQPILESPVTIQDADHPLGTHVFTAMERIGGNFEMRWSVVSLDSGHTDGGVADAKAALDRIVIPQDASALPSPRRETSLRQCPPQLIGGNWLIDNNYIWGFSRQTSAKEAANYCARTVSYITQVSITLVIISRTATLL